MSDVRYEIKTLLPVIWLWNIDFEKIRVGPSQRTTDPGSWLVDPVDDEDVEEIVHKLIFQTSDNVRSFRKDLAESALQKTVQGDRLTILIRAEP